MTEIIVLSIVVLVLFSAVLVSMGLDATSALIIVSVFFTIAIVIVVLKTTLKDSHRKMGIKEVLDYYRETVAKLPELKKIYDEAQQAFYHEFPAPMRTIENALSFFELPLFVKYTHFYDCYGQLYESIEGLLLLYVQKVTWPAKQLVNPYSALLVERIQDPNSTDDLIFTKHPWLIPLGSNFHQKNK